METTALALIAFAFFKAVKEDEGPKYCRKHLVGPLREVLERPTSAAPQPNDERAHKLAIDAMAHFCRICDGCELAGRKAA